jgi:predicted phage terminase large subunit-like protein
LQREGRQLLTASPAALALISSRGKWRLAPHLSFLNQTLLEAIESAAAGRLDGLVISMPPQHGKSELCSKYLPAWYLGKYPDRRVILTGYEADFAAQWGRKARDLLQAWGWAFRVRVSPKSSAVHRWDLEGSSGGMSTAGVAGPITGKGAHLLIVDDPIKNDAEARSARRRQKQFDWWQSTASTRLRPGALALLIQTRWHRQDLAGQILDSAAKGQRWREVRLTAIAEDRDPLERPMGRPLWPEMYSLEHLARIRDRLTNYYWRSLYQQDPIAEGTTEWPDSYFGPSIWFDEWPLSFKARVMALDPSKGNDAEFGDYSAFVKLQQHEDGTMYVDADLELRNVQLIVEKAVELCAEFRPCAFAIETNQFQELLATEIGRVGTSRKVAMPMYHVPNHVPKVIRIRKLTWHLAEGRFRFKRNSHGAQLLVQQLRDFPNGEHDDGPDALELALRMLIQCTSRRNDPGYTLEYGWT